MSLQESLLFDLEKSGTEKFTKERKNENKRTVQQIVALLENLFIAVGQRRDCRTAKVEDRLPN